MKTSRQKVYCFPSSIDLALVSQAEALKEENDSLRWQLDAYRNEVELLKQEQGKAHREDDPNKEQQLKLLQQALQGMQQVRTGCLEEQHPLFPNRCAEAKRSEVTSGYRYCWGLYEKSQLLAYDKMRISKYILG